jgi:bifunctional UDP-N-acetylglucosamine pyrophosphorylase/glucosamine-1-phosphate N-acetyltransferase
MDPHVVVLAAGKGTRMKSERPKVLHRISGVPMIAYPLETAARLEPRSITVVLGHEAENVRAALAGQPGLRFVIQEPQLGTAHALLAAEQSLAGASGTLLVLSGDVPLLKVETLERLLHEHAATGAAATVLTALVDDPHGYGRIIRSADSGHGLTRIVEQRDATPAEREVREINTGIYALALDGLFEAIRAIDSRNAQGEYYLPDLITVYQRRKLRVEAVTVADPGEIRGVNSLADLAEIGRALRRLKAAALMADGVTIEDPHTTYVDRDVTVGADTIIHPGVFLEGRTKVGARCELHGGARIVDSHVADDVVVLNHCVIVESSIESGVTIGPFAHLRADAKIGRRAKVGNFVEIKKTVLGEGSKSMHLTYLGDAVIGAGVNIGAGTITCNYDGIQKQTTTIEGGAFIGSDTQLIAPVTVGHDAYVGTGTTVREDVPAGALAVSAGKQRNIEGWVEKRLAARKTKAKG